MNEHKMNRFTRKMVSLLRKLNIYPRLFLMFCCLMIASTAFITLFNQTSYSRELESNTVKYQAVLVQNAMLKLQQKKESIEKSLMSFTQNDHVLQAIEQNVQIRQKEELSDDNWAKKALKNSEVIEHALVEIKQKMPGIRAVLLIAGENQYGVSNIQGSVQEPFVRDLDQFRESDIYRQAVAAAGYPSWQDSFQETPKLFFESNEGSFGIMGCLTLSYQLYSAESREPLGVLVCCFPPQYFTQALSEYSTKAGGNTFLLGENGLLEGIAAGLSAPAFPQERKPLYNVIFGQSQGNFTVANNERELLVSFCGMEDFPVRVANLTYRDVALRPAKKQEEINFWVSSAVILVGAFGFYITATSVAYPVKRLICTMKKVGAGDFNAMYKAESRDEIGTLCREFDHMVSDMKNLIDRVYVSEARERELELAKKSAELNALQMQVNPHFLYNTLDMIRWECMYENGGESPASDMIEKFCTLLRMTIKGDRQKETVADSLLHATTYLDVVNFRHTNKIGLETEFDFAPDAYLMPCLSLQPVLENAVRHGFQGENKAESIIRIHGVKTAQGDLQLTVTDNGHGMNAEQLAALRLSLEETPKQTGKSGIGLRNVHQRCKLWYGEQYGIQIDSKENVGTMVRLTIPAEEAFGTEEIGVV